MVSGRRGGPKRVTSLRGWLPCASLAALLVLTAAEGRADVYTYVDDYGVVHFTDSPTDARFRRRRPATVRIRPTRAWDGVIRRASDTHGVSAALVKAVIHAESGFHVQAVSHKGAQGLMQLMPRTADSLGVDDPFDAWQNIDGGTRYLGYLIGRYGGNIELALAAYNAGDRAVTRYKGIPPYQETQQYVKRVLVLSKRYDADFRR